MFYWGKIIGTISGLAMGRLWMVLLGFLIGHQFDRKLAERFFHYQRKEFDVHLDQLPEDFIKALFQIMGHLAKADGRVTEDEIQTVRTLMHRFGLVPSQIHQAIDWFESGKKRNFPLLATIRQFKQKSARRLEMRGLFVRLLMEVSLSKERLHQRERSLYWIVCTELDISRFEFAQLEAMTRAQYGFRSSPQGNTDAQRVQSAYRSLRISESSTNAEIKQAYRRLMNKNHPDKLASKNLDSVAISEAERKTREIRGAYEMLKARRSIR